MFGTQDKNDNQTAPVADQPLGSDMPSLDSPVGPPAPADDQKPAEDAPFNPFPTMITEDQATKAETDANSSPAEKSAPDTPAPEPVATEKAEEPPKEEAKPEPATGKKKGHKTVSPSSAEGSDELLQIKQEALQELTPLVDQLELAPEEKFKTTMMLLQATDNQELVKDAHEAAKSIPDEKIRAQALLDVVNEINYFTQQKETS